MKSGQKTNKGNNEFWIIVAGCRKFGDYKFVKAHLDKLLENKIGKYAVTIIEGGCRGVDALAGHYGRLNGHRVITKKADWDGLGSAAGPLRNREMAQMPVDACVVFSGGGSGSKSMIREATAANLSLRVIEI